MRLAVIRRAIVATAAITLLTIPVVSAESVVADSDIITAGTQGTIDLGTVQPSQDVTRDVFFVMSCSGTSHVDPGQVVKLTPSLRSFPTGGGFHVGTLLFGLGAGWPTDGQACPAGLPPVIGGPMHVTVTAPPDPGTDYTYRFTWSRSVTPVGNDDAGVFSGTNPEITFILDVAGTTPPPNTPPTLHLPADSTVDGNTTAGATVAYTATATDAEDVPAPTTVCAPASGSLFPLGVTTVSCSATDSGGLTTNGSFTITVVDTPPTLHLPADSTVEGNTTGGGTVAYTATATDVEDAVAPTASCNPASGALFALGTTTVSCSATDSGGLTTTGSFAVTVVDTTAPVMANIADIDVTTNDPSGMTVAFGSPSVADIVDSAPSVGCAPASGSTFPVGTTTVTCTAADASGNHSSMSFDVRVTYVPLVTWSAVWGEPVATSGSTFAANAGRTVPVKVDLFADGVRQTQGTALLTVATCGGVVVTSVPLTWDGGRWTGHLDTGDLGPSGCYLATASLDGHDAGSFRIDLRGAETPVAASKPAKNTPKK